MRIRTIKPQFWSHPVLRRLSDSTQLLAIGLLNYADDHGYFWAAPSLVRSALCPFTDDSVSVQTSLIQLAKVGFIELRKHETHGEIGWIVNFTKHQKVNRPNSSSIKDYWKQADSLNIQCVITEPSLNTQCRNKEEGIRNKEKENSSAPSAPVDIVPVSTEPALAPKPPEKPPRERSPAVLAEIPDNLRTEAFHAAWERWQQHRREKKKPVTPTNAFMLLKKLADMGPERAVIAIDHSITHGWQGIFEPNELSPPSNRPQPQKSFTGDDFKDLLPAPIEDPSDEPGNRIPI